jgi:hypothetical protein
MKPGAKLFGVHVIDAGGPGVLLNASERCRQVLAERNSSQRSPVAAG